MISKIRRPLWLLGLFLLAGCQAGPAATSTPSSAPFTSSAPATSSPAPFSAQATAPETPVRQPTALQSPSPAVDLSALPTLDDLAPGWNQIDPGGSTACAYGGKYSFFVRKADSDRLLIYFEGGGTCYDARTCAMGGNFFDGSIDPAYEADNPALKSAGVFALDDSRNPFKDYNIVFVSYCTGDAFMGNKVMTYQDSRGSVTIQHRGFENARTVLNWTYQNFTRPGSLFMIGCSAGVTGSYIHAPFILEHYQNVPATLVGDSGGGYLDGPAQFIRNFGLPDLYPSWLPQYQEMIEGDTLRTRFLFAIPAQAYPNARFGLLDTQGDAVQAEIITRFNSNLTLAQTLATNLKDIRSDAPGLVSYNGPGNYHCITMDPAYYEYQVNGVRLNDWFADLAAGKPVQNVAP